MRWSLTGWSLLLFAALAPAADLLGVDRSLTREPTYTKQPKYGLLVFGPQAKQRVWLVLDGDTLYVDKNGNGDLTEPGEHMAVSRTVRSPEPAVAEVRTYYERVPRERLGGRIVPSLPSSGREVWFFLEHYVPRPGFQPKNADEARLQRRLARGLIRVGFLFDGEFGQTGQAVCATRPADAPVVHFDGPRTLAVSTGSVFNASNGLPPLRRGEENDLIVHLVTPGLGDGTITVWDNAYVPADTHPVAEIEFPSRPPARGPIRLRAALKERC